MAATLLEEELIAIEELAWRALSTSGDAAAAFYDHRLASEVVVLLPGGTVITDRQQVVDSMRGEPWSDYELSDVRALPLGDDAAILTYRAVAQRGDQHYEALLASTFRRELDEWKLAAHQQTPV